MNENLKASAGINRRLEFRRILLEALLVAAVGSVIAFVANAVSPRGLILARNYFPGATHGTVSAPPLSVITGIKEKGTAPGGRGGGPPPVWGSTVPAAVGCLHRCPGAPDPIVKGTSRGLINSIPITPRPAWPPSLPHACRPKKSWFTATAAIARTANSPRWRSGMRGYRIRNWRSSWGGFRSGPRMDGLWRQVNETAGSPAIPAMNGDRSSQTHRPVRMDGTHRPLSAGGGVCLHGSRSKPCTRSISSKWCEPTRWCAIPVLLNSIAAALPWFEVVCGGLLLAGVAVRGSALILMPCWSRSPGWFCTGPWRWTPPFHFARFNSIAAAARAKSRSAGNCWRTSFSYCFPAGWCLPPAKDSVFATGWFEAVV